MNGVLFVLGDLALVLSGAAAGYAFRALQDAKRSAAQAERDLMMTVRRLHSWTNGGDLFAVPQPSDPDYDEEAQ